MLSKNQLDVYQELKTKKRAGLSLPMGSGKTLIGLTIIKETLGTHLLIVSKTLLSSWEQEIKKFYPELKYQILVNGQKKFEIDNDTKLVITTPTTLRKHFLDENLVKNVRTKTIINQNQFNQHEKYIYQTPNKIVGNKDSFFYGRKWDIFIVDEIQNYLNITTPTCQSIVCIYSEYKYLLSGTILTEPKLERLIGYHKILGDEQFPTNVRALRRLIKKKQYQGLEQTLVRRNQNPMYTPVQEKIHVHTHTLNEHEEIIYKIMKQLIFDVQQISQKFKDIGDIETSRRYRTGLLALIVYLRQSIVCPLLPISSAILDLSSQKNVSPISKLLIKKIKEKNLYEYMNNKDSYKSTRIKEILNVLKNTKENKILLFSSFRTLIDLMNFSIKQETKIKVYLLESEQNIEQRQATIQMFKDEKEQAILLSTYQLGGEGLNLQFCNTIIMIDFWWNESMQKQSIARINRYGQQSNIVNVHMFSSNTAIEKAILEKQIDKKQSITQLLIGHQQMSSVQKIKMQDIIDILKFGEENNKKLIKELY